MASLRLAGGSAAEAKAASISADRVGNYLRRKEVQLHFQKLTSVTQDKNGHLSSISVKVASYFISSRTATLSVSLPLQE